MPLKRQHRNTNVIYYFSHDESIIKALFLCWAKYIQHMHPQEQVPHRNAVQYFKKIFCLFKLGTTSASWISNTPGLHLPQRAQAEGIMESDLTGTQGTIITGCRAVSLNWGWLEWSTTREMDGDEGTTRTSDTQLTEEAQGGYCSNPS